MTSVAVPGLPLSLDLDIITPEGLEEARARWHDGEIIEEKGGPGSGHKGHKGRPGKVGGRDDE